MTDALETRPPWESLAALIEAGERPAVRAFVDGLGPQDVVRVVAALRDEERTKLLAMLRPEDAADVIEALPDVQVTDAFESLAPARAARILEELPSDAQADLLGELDAPEAEAILARLDPQDAEELRALAAYDEDTAGGLMITELVRVPVDATVQEVVDDLGRHAGEYAAYDVQYAYVEDPRRRLVGVLRLRDLLLARRTQAIRTLMIREPQAVRVEAQLPEIERFFDEHGFYGAPVVDGEGVLVGVLRRAAVEEAVAERSDETFRATQGIVGGEELRSMPLWLRSRRRLAWLSTNILLNVLAASVIAAHQDTLQAVIALAVFLPIISDMSGCSGNQAVAVSLRELTLGVIHPTDALRVLTAELRVGLVNGLALGLLIGLVAWAWKGNPWLGLVAGGALALNTVVAVGVGGVIPLVLKRLGRDPALASGPILTTVTDMVGFFLVLSLASLALARLT